MTQLFATDTARFDAWKSFHAANPRVWTLFLRFARGAIAAGKQSFGARMIWERMRWEVEIETTDEEFKLNNNHAPYLARLAMGLYPEEFGGVFELRDSHFDASVEEIVAAHLEITRA